MNYLLKVFIGFFLLNNPVSAKESNPSFLFSEKEGLQVLPIPDEKQKENTKGQYQKNKVIKSDEQIKTSQDTGFSVKSQEEGGQSAPPNTAHSEKKEVINSPVEPHLEGNQPVSSNTTTHSGKKEIVNFPPKSTPEGNQELNSSIKLQLKEGEIANFFSPSNLEEENEDLPKNSISEDFAPKKEQTQDTGFSNIVSNNISWFFQKKKTKHKIALIPVPYYNLTYGFRLGLRFFAYSADKRGYYFSFSGSKYLSSPFFRLDTSFIENRKKNLRTESSLIYDNHYQNYFGEGMKAKLSDLKKLYAQRFTANHELFYQPSLKGFYGGLGAQIFFRRERPQFQEGQKHFENELFLFLKAFAGYDSRDNWRNPKTGVFHQFLFGCKLISIDQNSHCKGEGDLRFYVSLLKGADLHPSLKNSVLALRAFAGSSFFSHSSYSLAYSLGGQNSFQKLNSLRGFAENRFRGDKMYFAQTEIRIPIWQKYIDGVLFGELGEVASYKESFKGFVIDYGGGFRFGLPPEYDMKIRFDFGAGYDKQGKINYNIIVNFLHSF